MKSLTLSLVILIASAESLYAQVKLKAFDSYGNTMVELLLLDDGTFKLNERFLDGSTLKDEGIWTRKGAEIVLMSPNKSTREHALMEFKKEKKFNGERMLLKEGAVQFQGKWKRRSTAYFKEYKWVIYQP